MLFFYMIFVHASLYVLNVWTSYVLSYYIVRVSWHIPVHQFVDPPDSGGWIFHEVVTYVCICIQKTWHDRWTKMSYIKIWPRLQRLKIEVAHSNGWNQGTHVRQQSMSQRTRASVFLQPWQVLPQLGRWSKIMTNDCHQHQWANQERKRNEESSSINKTSIPTTKITKAGNSTVPSGNPTW